MPPNEPDAASVLRRPRLEALLDRARDRRLTAIVAGPGFGKSTLLHQWSDRGGTVAWHTVTPFDADLPVLAHDLVERLRLAVPELSPDLVAVLEGGTDAGADPGRAEAIAAAIAEDLAAHLERDLLLVLDDLHTVHGSPEAAHFLGALCRHAPPTLHLVMATREPLPFPTARLRMADDAVELTEVELAFTVDEVEALVAGRHGDADPTALFDATGGWPIMVAFAARAGTSPAAHGGPVFDYLAEEVLAGEPVALVSALQLAAELPWVAAELFAEVGAPDESKAIVDAAGLFVTPALGAPGVVITPLLRQYMLGARPIDDQRREALLIGAARWYASQDAHAEALQCHARVGCTPAGLQFLRERRVPLLAAGLARQIVDCLDGGGPDGDEELALLEAEARQILGDWDGAMRCYRDLVDDDGPVAARVAWRLGQLYHMRGDAPAALAVYARGDVAGASPIDRAALLAWTASSHWLRGERDAAKALADEALVVAREADDDRSLATAHTVLAMVAALDGDRAANDRHYLRALAHAERARDLVQTIRIRSNRGSHFLEEGQFDAALAELDIALRLADMTGFELWRGMSRVNRGEVLLAKGRIEEAHADLEASRQIFRRLGSRFEAYPLLHLGDAYAERGESALARASYEESIALAEESSDLQALVPAWSGLARMLVADEPERAARLVARAVDEPSAIAHARALVAAGWVARATSGADVALDLAHRAGEIGRARRDHPGVAAALELEAAVVPDRAGELLGQARAIWERLGVPVGVARVDVAAGLAAADDDGAHAAADAADRLDALGARGLARDARRRLEARTRSGVRPLGITCFGSLAVFVEGEPVPASAWQSRVAREIVGMLVANRGRPLHREVLIARLWPDDELAKASNRLSVALSTIRGVFDPGKAHPAGQYLDADRDRVALRLEEVSVDVEDFLGEAERGRQLLSSGDRDRGLGLLRRAESRYVGDFLEDNPYAEWAVALREEARAVYLSISEQLARADRDAGAHDEAARRCLRMIERDPYLEQAYLDAITAMTALGRHGSARRLYGIYSSRMGELDIEPAPFPPAS